jgi:MFS family permease
MFWGQVIGFTPLYLAQLGVPPPDIAGWTGAVAAVSMALGLPFLPLWGALADRYARKPVIVRSFAAYLIAGIVTFLAPNLWIFTLGRAVMGFALAFAIMNASSPIGAFIGPIVGARSSMPRAWASRGWCWSMVSCCWRSSPPWDLAIETRSS